MESPLNRRLFLATTAIAATSSLDATATQSTNPPDDIRGVTMTEAEEIRKLVRDFMNKHAVPGLSLAMSSAGKLKLTVCMGVANKKDNETVRPHHRFRIASVSKPLTSILVMLLRQQGQLDIDQPVFSERLLGYETATAQLGNENQRRLKKVTTRHLLEHSAGGWSNQSHDPMFTSDALGLDHDGLIRWTLAHRKLDNPPGMKYAYSNFGYCLIGRVVEKVTLQSYEQALRSKILQPFGLKNLSLQLGGNTIAEKLPNEVTYYGQDEDPYHQIMNVRRMDAHGGLVATPTDLVRLANRADGFPSPADLLSSDSLRTMTSPSATNPSYAKGWSVNKSNNWWHTGSFNGGSAILVRTSDNHCWAMTMNTRSHSQDYGTDLDQLPWKIKNCVTKWGSHDLLG